MHYARDENPRQGGGAENVHTQSGDPPALRTVLWAIDAGLWPVPISPIDDRRAKHPGKAPIGDAWGLERHDADWFRETFRQHPGAGVGLKLGADAGVIDIDVDDPASATVPLERLFPDGIPPTLGWTNAGGKFHLLFRWDERLASYGKSIIKGPPYYPGIEIRIGAAPGATKQVQSVIPPSLLITGQARRWNDGKEILPLPASVLADLDRHAPNRAATKPSPTPVAVVNGSLDPYARKAFDAELAELSRAGEGDRNARLNTAAFNLGTLVGAGVLAESEVVSALETTANAIGLDSGEIRPTIRSGLDSGKARPRDMGRVNGKPAKLTGSSEPVSPPSQPRATGDDDLSTLSDDDLGIIHFESVKERPIRWLWKYRLAMGGLAMMAGDGGIGKSQLLLAIATAVSTGGTWPDGSGNAPVGNVVILSAEDRPEDTIKPRLMAMHANLNRIITIKSNYVIRRSGKAPVLKLVNFQDRAYWKEVFRRLPECRLFIADPVPSYLGRGVNDSKNIEIRNVLEPFIEEIISPLNICMLGNTHLNKSVDAKTPMHRISGSIAYGTLPRNVHFVVRDPEDPERRFFKQAKCNNAPDDLSAIAFRVESRTVVNADGEAIETAVPVFESTPVDVNLGDAVNGSRSGKRGPEPKKTLTVAVWLYEFLSDRSGATPIAAVFDAAGEAGLIGSKREGKWSGVGTLYDALKAVPTLPEPRAGKRVETLETTIKDRGRMVKHWYLCNADAEF